MKAERMTVTRVCDLQTGVSTRGEEWASRDIVLKDNSQQYGDEICARLRGDNARSCTLRVGDVVDAYLGFMTREYVDRNNQMRLSTEITCWKTEKTNV